MVHLRTVKAATELDNLYHADKILNYFPTNFKSILLVGCTTSEFGFWEHLCYVALSYGLLCCKIGYVHFS
jgi:hypothetical protein